MEYNRDWTYSVASEDFPEEKVKEVFSEYCPWCFTLEKYSGVFQPPWQTVINSTYGSYPSPRMDWGIVFFRRDTNEFHIQNAAGLGGGRKCTISWVPWENNEVLGLRIWHEMLHSSAGGSGMSLNSDMMVKNDLVEFIAWLKIRYPSAIGDFETNYMTHENDPNYQKYYYKMLTEKLYPPYKSVPVVDFVASKTSGPAPLTVSFTDKTQGYYKTREWKVYGPDGMKLKTDQNPTFELTVPGSYRVALVVFDGFDTVYKDIKNYITIAGNTPSLFERFLAWIKRMLS